MNNTTTKSENKEIVISRTFKTLRKQIWQAWTKPSQIEQWWGPRGFTTRVDELEFHPGGRFKYTMLDADENEYPSVGVFKKYLSPNVLLQRMNLDNLITMNRLHRKDCPPE